MHCRVPLIALMQKRMSFSVDVAYNAHLFPATVYAKASSAKFIFCPSGLGLDTFRLWESLVLGGIPVVESNAGGLDRTYGSLPVLVVRDYADVTEALLHEAYACFSKHASLYKYHHLTLTYWQQVLRNIARTGSSESYNAEHPFVNEYCNFLS
jgi:hypothetical protein